MRLYISYFKMLLKAQLQYRVSFWLLSMGQFFIPFSIFASLYFLFERFGPIKGWSFYEVALCFSIIHIAFSISECCARGFDSFSGMVSAGDFDRLLVRPRSTFLQVLGSRFEFTRIGRLMQGIVVFLIALANLQIQWNIPKLITMLLMIVCGVFVFTGIFILAATLCFWTVQGIEVANIFTDGGREISQYPLNIYKNVAMWSATECFSSIHGCIFYDPVDL